MNSQKVPLGLHIIEEYISEETEQYILSELSKRGDKNFNKNPAPQWGIFSPNDPPGMKLDEFQTFCFQLSSKFKEEGLTLEKFNSCIAGEFSPGDGFNPHIDSVEMIGESIITLNLGTGIGLEFGLGEEKFEVFYPARSLAVMRGLSRYYYTHAISRRDFDIVDGQKIPRGKRIGMIWRLFHPEIWYSIERSKKALDRIKYLRPYAFR